MSDEQDSALTRHIKKFKKMMADAAGRFELYKNLAEGHMGRPLTEAELEHYRRQAEVPPREPTTAELQAGEREYERWDAFIARNKDKLQIEQAEALIETQERTNELQQRTNQLLKQLLDAPRATIVAPHQATNSGARRPASEADYQDGLAWSASRRRDGKTSGNQLRDDAPKWCTDHGVIYSRRRDWEEALERYPHLKRLPGSH